MKHRKRLGTAIARRLCITLLLVLFFPSWGLSQPSGEQQKEGFFRAIYRLLVESNPKHVQSSDMIAGVKDIRDPDAPSGVGHSIIISPDGAIVFVSDTLGVKADPLPIPSIFDYPNQKPSQADKLRARVAARRAKKALKAAQEEVQKGTLPQQKPEVSPATQTPAQVEEDMNDGGY